MQISPVDTSEASMVFWMLQDIKESCTNKYYLACVCVCVFIWCSVVLLPWVQFSLVWRWGQHEWWRTSWWHLCRVKHVHSSGVFFFFREYRKDEGFTSDLRMSEGALCVLVLSLKLPLSSSSLLPTNERHNNQKKKMFHCSGTKGGLTLCERHHVPDLPAVAQQNRQLFYSPVLLPARHVLGFLSSVKVLQRRSSSVLTFSSLEANRDSIPSFNLWYSWSDQINGTLKCYFRVHTRLVTAEFSGMWWNV